MSRFSVAQQRFCLFVFLKTRIRRGTFDGNGCVIQVFLSPLSLYLWKVGISVDRNTYKYGDDNDNEGGGTFSPHCLRFCLPVDSM